jgi:hypothetical protein
MDVKLEHASIIDQKNQLLCSSHKGDIQFFFGIVTFAPPCIIDMIVGNNGLSNHDLLEKSSKLSEKMLVNSD